MLQQCDIEQCILRLLDCPIELKMRLCDKPSPNHLKPRRTKINAQIARIFVQQTQLHFFRQRKVTMFRLGSKGKRNRLFAVYIALKPKHQQIRRFLRQLFHCG